MRVEHVEIVRTSAEGLPLFGQVVFGDGQTYDWRRHKGSGELFFSVYRNGAGGNERFWFRSKRRQQALERELSRGMGAPARVRHFSPK